LSPAAATKPKWSLEQTYLGDLICLTTDIFSKDGAIVSWHWWSFIGTNYEGSAVTRTTDEGVRYERITYYPITPEFPVKS